MQSGKIGGGDRGIPVDTGEERNGSATGARWTGGACGTVGADRAGDALGSGGAGRTGDTESCRTGGAGGPGGPDRATYDGNHGHGRRAKVPRLVAVVATTSAVAVTVVVSASAAHGNLVCRLNVVTSPIILIVCGDNGI